jgi:hypothetical protein
MEDEIVLSIDEIKSLYDKKMYNELELKIADFIEMYSKKYA